MFYRGVCFVSFFSFRASLPGNRAESLLCSAAGMRYSWYRWMPLCRMESEKDYWGLEEDNAERREDDSAVWADSSWKRDDAASGWDNEEDGWGSPPHPGELHSRGSESRGGFLMKRRLGVEIESIFDGPKTLTR